MTELEACELLRHHGYTCTIGCSCIVGTDIICTLSRWDYIDAYIRCHSVQIYVRRLNRFHVVLLADNAARLKLQLILRENDAIKGEQ